MVFVSVSLPIIGKGEALETAPHHKIKVRIHIPEKVACRQVKINRIYDILKPRNALENRSGAGYNSGNVLSAPDKSGGRT